MNLLIFKIILILLTIRIIWLIIKHLIIVFCDKATEDYTAEILKDPIHYVKEDHACKFMYDMIWLYLFIKILISAYMGQIIFS